jgi:uncharacterized protein (TIGR02996 family)
MDLEGALLQAIHDAPTDEAPWLVLADWLEENDQPGRAELVRLQFGLCLEPEGPRRLAWEERLRQLLASGVRPCVPTLTNSLGMTLALIPPGKFWMGSPDDEDGHSAHEGPQHEVEITRPFYLGVFPVTQEQYQKVMGTNPSWFSAEGGGKDKVTGLDTGNFPVERVSWEDAVAFCKDLSEMPEEKRKKRLYRLPTEAEWEYACRGGASSSSPFHFGASLSSTQANFDGNYPYGGAALGPYLRRTCAVGSHKPNAFGLHDLHGNVWEWCADWYGENYYNQSPRQGPQGPQNGGRCVLRGGSWYNYAEGCRAATRYWYEPSDRVNDLGFRVVLVPA